MQFTRLLPEPGTVGLDTLRDGLAFPAVKDRPYTIANFACTADGRAALRGRSAPLSSRGDRAMFHALRERVDAVIAGTKTLHTERYRRLIRDPDARRRRAQRGLAPEPLACVVTRTGALPTDIPLFGEGDARIVVFTTLDAATPPTAEAVRLDPSELTPLTVLRRLKDDYAVGSLLCEGGPTLFGSLLRGGLVDELFLTVSPQLAGGGSAPTIATGGELANPVELTLQWALERNGSLFLRYAVSIGGT